MKIVRLREAKRMRNNPTRGEAKLWLLILLGYRRQYAKFPKYILDFYSPIWRVAVEVDGTSHAKRRHYDRSRDRWFRGLGVYTLRVSDQRAQKRSPLLIGEIILTGILWLSYQVLKDAMTIKK